MDDPHLKIDDDGRVSFRRDLAPERGAELAWSHLQKLIDQYNESRASATQTAVNEALERAAVLLGDMADAEEANRGYCPRCNRCEVSVALSLNAAAIKVRNLKNG